MSSAKIFNQLEAMLDEYEPGYSNPEAINAFNELLKQLEESTEAPRNLVTEKTSGIRGWLQILYSPRKHQKHGGVDRVKLYVRQDLAGLRSIVSSIKTSERLSE